MRHVLLGCVAIVLAGCGGAKVAPNALFVGTDATYRPFEFQERAGVFEGYDIDLIQAIGKELGRPVEMRNGPFNDLISGLKAEKYDVIISCLSITPERAKEIAFSDPYYDAGQIIAVRADEAKIAGRADLKGKKIGAQQATTGETEAKALGGTVKSYETIDLAFQDLANGQIDAIVNDEPVSRWLVAKRPGFKLVGEVFTKEQYGIGVRKADAALLADINRALKKLRDSGELTRLCEKWITKPQ